MSCVDDKQLAARLARLYARRQFTIKLGLDAITALTDALERPHAEYAVVHVAGTNGKGSTCACLESILRAAGLRTGLYTSPHLLRFNERIRIDGACISDAVLAEAMDTIDAACRRAGLEGDRDPTFFEYTTALAWHVFREAGVQVAVIETGLGGRLDATNIVTPVVAVITPVGIDHAEHLGPTLDRIAFEKAGILKSGRPAVIAPQQESAMAVMLRVAAERQVPVYRVDQAVSVRARPVDAISQRLYYESTAGLAGAFVLPLAGEHQTVNAATAILAAEVFADLAGVAVDPVVVREGLRRVQWPGRFARIETTPPLYADVAHNPAGARALARLLSGQGQQPVGLIVGMCADKDVETTVRAWCPVARRMWAVPLPNSRGADPERIVAAAGGSAADASPSLAEALRQARHWAACENGLICVTGSIFLVGELYRMLAQGGDLYGSGRDPR